MPTLQGREYSEDDLREICAAVLRGKVAKNETIYKNTNSII